MCVCVCVCVYIYVPDIVDLRGRVGVRSTLGVQQRKIKIPSERKNQKKKQRIQLNEESKKKKGGADQRRRIGDGALRRVAREVQKQ